MPFSGIAALRGLGSTVSKQPSVLRHKGPKAAENGRAERGGRVMDRGALRTSYLAGLGSAVSCPVACWPESC